MAGTRALVWIVIGFVACGRGDTQRAARDATVDTETCAVAAGPAGPAKASPPGSASSTGTPLPRDCTGSQAALDLAAADAPGATLEQRIASVVPTPSEEKFLTVPWRTNLMAARQEAQEAGKPIFLWIMVGNPQGCT